MVRSPLMAASATFALKAGVWFRRGRLDMVSPDSQATACLPSGRNSTYRLVQISATGSHIGRGLNHVRVDQCTVVHDLAFGTMDEAHTAHVCSQLIDLIHPRPECVKTVFRVAEVEDAEFVRLTGAELGLFDIDAADPVTFHLQAIHQMPSNESASTAHHRCFHFFL